MKILVYGAGVLGSYLAHVLVRGGNDVTVLARGQRAEELERDGIVIRHYFQYKTTVDPVRVARTLEAEEHYDLIFVVMKYNDFPAVLPILANNQSSNIVIVGNNADARNMQMYLVDNSGGKKQVAFGFQISGGRRDKGRVLCVRGGGQMVLGGLDGPISFKAVLDKAFGNVNYKLKFHEDIDAWLKSHIVPILVLNSVSFTKEGKMKNIDSDKKLLQQMIAAMDECFGVLEAMGVAITPANQAGLIRNHKRLMYALLKIYSILPMTKLIDGTFGEIAALNNGFTEWKKKVNRATPNWDAIEKRFLNSN